MTLAATNDGIRDVETGAVTLAGREVTHLVCTADTPWAHVATGLPQIRNLVVTSS
jgi:hypothetical protein